MSNTLITLDRSTKWLIGIIAFMVLTPLIAQLLPAADHELAPGLHKTYLLLHILGAILFLGNIIVTGVWMLLAERSRSVPVIRFAVQAVNWADVYFTAPGAALLLLFGLALTRTEGGFEVAWIMLGMLLFALSGILWLLFLIPDQHRMITLSAETTNELPPEFFRTLHRWYLWGVIATLLPLATLYLMVQKPTLWNGSDRAIHDTVYEAR